MYQHVYVSNHYQIMHKYINAIYPLVVAAPVYMYVIWRV